MRNLKRALSLTLASVMLLGMMVVGSSAAAGYDDVADTDNVEAIEVLQAVEVMVGDERGFGPERPVNRAEMAVVMGKLLNLDYNYYEATCPFNDVYDWARGWVGACYANGIVSGRGEGVYDPGTTVTAVEAASMLMRALGYFKYQSDYANGFEVSTVLQANKIRLFDGVNSKTNEPLTRNQVAQMALNALKSGMVEPDGNALNFIDANGNVIATGGKVNYVFVTSNKTFATAISSVKASSMGSSNDSPIVELGEQLYDGKLKLTDTTDVFGRPSRNWEFDAKDIGTYVKKELIKEEYTVKVTGRTLHDLLGSTILKDYDLDVYIDGVTDPDINPAVFDANSLVRTNDVGVGATGKGVLTQVFVDPDEGANGLITIAIINTYLAIADEDFDDRTDDVDITVYGIQEKFISNQRSEYVKNAKNDDGTSANQNEDFKLETEDFPEIVDVKDGDAFLVNVADGEVQTLSKPEILSETQITSFKQADWLVTGGTQYDFASAAEYECETLYDYTITGTGVVNLKDISYNVYLDQFGYAIGVKEVDRVDNYLFITGLDTNTNNRYAVQADASAIFLDGTMDAIKIDMKAARDLNDQTYNALTNGEKGGSLVNKWFSYTVGSDGIYEVVLVGDYTTVEKTRAGQFRTLTDDETNDIAYDGHETYTDRELVEYYDKSVSGVVTGLGGTHGVDEISRKSIAMRGADTANSTWYSVYGDDKSVYITAELKTIQDAHGVQTMVNVIGGVDNVAVGIDEASIDVYTKAEALKKDRGANAAAPATQTAHGSYVLYDKDGDIIAAVVVGEDSGSVTNLVYTHKEKIESETDNNASSSSRATVKGDYTWTRKVVSNGEEVLLTEVGSGLSKLKSMQPYTWYVVKYNAKGEVKNVYPAWDTDASYGSYYGNGYKGMISDPAGKADAETVRLEDKYVNNIEELNTATNENSMVLYEVGQYNTGRLINGKTVRTEWDGKAVGNIDYLGGPNTEIVDNLRKSGKPQVDNHTLYITTDTNESLHRGFRVADDVKTVFIQKNNNDWTTTFEDGYSRLEKVVNRLHDHDETGTWANTSERNYYHYEISAVMENGKATVVVIRDLNNAGAIIDPSSRYYELKLYGNLFTADSHVTGASNAVVVANDQEVEPTRIGTDKFWGNYTVYSIREGSEVGITDYDIDNSDPGFVYMSNMYRGDLSVRYRNRSISFQMPDYNVWIDGGKGETAFDEIIKGAIDAKEPSLTNLDVTFNGGNGDKLPGQDIGTLGYADAVEIVISNKPTRAAALRLEPNTQYRVTIAGEPDWVFDGREAVSDANGEIRFTYYLTGYDIRQGCVTVLSVEKVGASDIDKPGVEYVNVTFTGDHFTTTGATRIEKGASGSITIKAAEGYVITKVGDTDHNKVESVTWNYSKIQADATVAVVTEPKTVISSDLTVTSGTEATVPAEQVNKELTLTVKGGEKNGWYTVTGGNLDVNGHYCAQADVNGDVMFTYTPTSDKLTITLTETKFLTNPLTQKPCLFGEVSTGVYGMIDYEKLTIKGMASRAAVGNVTKDEVGALVAMTIGDQKVYFVNKLVNGTATLVLAKLDATTADNINKAIQGATPDPDTGLVTVALEKETITTDGKAAVSTDETTTPKKTTINLDLGQPKAVGVKLPTEVTIDGKVTAKVNWYYPSTSTTPLKGDGLIATDTKGYRFEVVAPVVTDSTIKFPVDVVNPADVTDTESIQDAAALSKVAVTNNDIKTDYKAPEDPSVLKDWSLEGTVYTFPYYTEANRPSKRIIENTIKKDQGVYDVEIADIGTSGKVTDVVVEMAMKNTDILADSGFTVDLVPMTKVIRNGDTETPFCWIEKKTGAQTLSGFATGDVVIAGKQGVKIGTPLTMEGTNASVDLDTAAYKVNNALVDDLYIYDAICVKSEITNVPNKIKAVTFACPDSMTDAEKTAYNDFLDDASFGVVPGTTLKVTAAASNNTKTYQLQINGEYTSKCSRVAAAVGTDPHDYGTIAITKDMVGNKDNSYKGTVTIGEAGEVITVKLGTKSYYVVAGKDLKIEDSSLVNDTYYIRNAVANVTAESVKNGVLTLTNVTDTTVDEKDDDIITLYKAAQFIPGADVMSTDDGEVKAPVAVLKGKTLADAGSEEIADITASGAYVAVGNTVILYAKDALTNISSETVTLTPDVDSNKTADSDSKIRYCYTFTMGEKRVTDIKKGSNITVGTMPVDTTLLTQPGKSVSFTVTLTAGSADADLVLDPVWYDASGYKLTADMTASAKKTASTADSTTWTITITSGSTGVTASTYVLKYTVDGVEMKQNVAVANPTVVGNLSVSVADVTDKNIFGETLPEVTLTDGDSHLNESGDALKGAWDEESVAVPGAKHTLTFTISPKATYTLTGATFPTITGATCKGYADGKLTYEVTAPDKIAVTVSVPTGKNETNIGTESVALTGITSGTNVGSTAASSLVYTWYVAGAKVDGAETNQLALTGVNKPGTYAIRVEVRLTAEGEVIAEGTADLVVADSKA